MSGAAVHVRACDVVGELGGGGGQPLPAQGGKLKMGSVGEQPGAFGHIVEEGQIGHGPFAAAQDKGRVLIQTDASRERLQKEGRKPALVAQSDGRARPQEPPQREPDARENPGADRDGVWGAGPGMSHRMRRGDGFAPESRRAQRQKQSRPAWV